MRVWHRGVMTTPPETPRPNRDDGTDPDLDTVRAELIEALGMPLLLELATRLPVLSALMEVAKVHGGKAARDALHAAGPSPLELIRAGQVRPALDALERAVNPRR